MSVRKGTLKQQERESIQSLIEKVKSYWPDLVINESYLQKPESSFVYKFYSRVISEYEKKLSEIKTGHIKQEHVQLVDNNTYIDEISLAIKLKKIFKQLDIAPFYLNDMCEPQPKRTVMYFTILMNLLIYVNSDTEFYDEIFEVVEKAENFQKLYAEKQSILKEIEDLGILRVKLKDNCERLSEDIRNIMSEYEDVLKYKAEKEFEHHKDTKFMDKLVERIKSMDEYLMKLRVEFNSLLEEIVEETEVDELKNKISTLHKQINNCDIDYSSYVSNLEIQENSVKHQHKCLELIGSSEFNIEDLNHLRISIENLFETNLDIKKLNEELSDKRVEENKLKNEEVNLKEKILVSKKALSDLRHEMNENIEVLRKKYHKLSEKIHHDINISKHYEIDINKAHSKIADLKDDIALLNANVMGEYAKVLENEAAIYNRFNNALIHIDNFQRENSCDE